MSYQGLGYHRSPTFKGSIMMVVMGAASTWICDIQVLKSACFLSIPVFTP